MPPNLGAIAFIAAIACISLCLPSAAGGETSASLPRYKLTPGQKLAYESRSERKGDSSSTIDTGTLELTVLTREPDGACRVVTRSASAYRQVRQDGEAYASPERVTMDFFRIYPDGRIVPDETGAGKPKMNYSLPVLPSDAAQARIGWTLDLGGPFQTKIEYSHDGAASQPGRFMIAAQFKGMDDDIYKSSMSQWYDFDLARGMVAAKRVEASQGFGIVGKTEGFTTLTQAAQIGPAELEKLVIELATYQRATKAYGKLLEQVETDAAAAPAILSRAVQTLRDAKSGVTAPLLVEDLDRRIDAHDESAEYMAKDAKWRAKLIGKPAAEWEAADLDGTTHTLKQYRGKVVVMDFWYRGCGWCIAAMPAIKEVSDHFRDKPVAVLGINKDRKAEDARFVVDKLGLNYATIRGENIPEMYDVSGFPTLLLVDQQGVVREVHVGYSEDLKQKLVESVGKLLAEPKP